MILLKIDNKEILVEEGTTLLEAAALAGISVPSMCYLKGHGNHPSCMVCLVKDNKSGTLLPSCSIKVANGMDISASDQEVLKARQQSLELLLSDHVGDCEAPCSLACPAGMDIPRMNRLIGQGRFAEALKVVKEDIALPYILGYICPAPCEKACRRKQIDDAVSVCLLKRFTAASSGDKEIEELARNKIPSTSKKIAIIGSGPAGLAAAYYLQRYGHACHIFEKSELPGGTLRHSIPEEVLPREIIDKETETIRLHGTTFHFNTLVNEQVFNSKIKDSFDAVILATGDISTDNHLSGLFTLSKTGYQVNENDMCTSTPGIFVCGSAVRPHKMAVRSVAQGKMAAESVNAYLNQRTYEKEARIFNSRFDKLLPEEFDEFLKESNTSGRLNPDAGYLGGFSEQEAVAEAQRCLHCDCRKQDNCKLREYAHACNIDRKRYLVSDRRLMTRQIQHDSIIFEAEKCIKCGICIEISAREGEKYGLAFEGRGFDVFINTPLGVSFTESLSHTAAECARNCPTGALALRDHPSEIIPKE